MIATQSWLQASFHAGKVWLSAPFARQTGAAAPASALVPIRTLSARHRDRIAAHLLALAPEDRYLRFGYSASDAQIRHYVAHLDFIRDEIFGIYNRRLDLVAMAHLAYAQGEARDLFHTGSAEFGVSVLPRLRGRGVGGRLFERAMVHARNAGVGQIVIHALSENTAMLKIARKAGATVERDGPESEAYLALPPASFDSRMAQIVDHHIGEVDYRMKREARRVHDVVGDLQEVREGMRRARGQSAA
jgi:RimJ/RimL family protein N-acetyltransferase